MLHMNRKVAFFKVQQNECLKERKVIVEVEFEKNSSKRV